MSSPVAWSALLLSAGALAVGVYAVNQHDAPPIEVGADEDVEMRLTRIEASLRRMAEAAEAQQALALAGEESSDAAPLLRGRAPRGTPRGEDGEAPASVDVDVPEDEEVVATSEAGVEAMIERAVARKAAQIQFMQKNKKPTLDQFAKTLGLDDTQRAVVEELVLESQRGIAAVLGTPAADGTDFMASIVDAFAHQMTNPGDKSRWTGVFTRLFQGALSRHRPDLLRAYLGHQARPPRNL